MKNKQCSHFPMCGGCESLHLDYSEQLNQKNQQIKNLFGSIAWQIAPIHATSEQISYRNKVQLPVANISKKVSIGCFAKNSHQIVNQEHCLIQTEAANYLVHLIRIWIKSQKVPCYNESSQKGWLRYISIRTNEKDELMLSFITTSSQGKWDSKRLKESWLSFFQAQQSKLRVISGFHIINDTTGNTVLSDHATHLWGKQNLTLQLADYKLQLGPLSFFQVNSEQAIKLYKLGVQMLSPAENCLELYCGVGSLSLFLSERFTHIHAVEINSEATQIAERNALINKVESIQFHNQDAEKFVDNFTSKIDAIVVDPPRKGLTPKEIEFISTCGAKEFLYISCNPNTLQRDAKLLLQTFDLEKVVPVDMFPHTEHIETIALFKRK